MSKLIEISSKKTKAGRTPVKFILHEIYENNSIYNKNGISWNRKYTEKNMESVVGMPLVCQFADINNEIPYGGHGDMHVGKDGEIIFEDSLVVGSFESAYIDDELEVNGRKISGLVGEGYVYDQRFPKLVEFLQDQYENGLPVESSVEINADKSNGNKKIIYDGGYKEKGRIPKTYQYSGQALCIGEIPADDSALMIELNQARKNLKEDEVLNKNTKSVELSELSYDDIASIVTRAFNLIMREDNTNDEVYKYYEIYKLYPSSNRVVMYDYSYNTGLRTYYLTTYKVNNKNVTFTEVTEVEMDWKPVETEEAIEISTSVKEMILKKIKKEDFKDMGEVNKDASVVELNAQIVEKVNEINELQKTVSEKDTEIENLKTEKAELNELLVEANKSLETQKTEIAELNEEIEPLRQMKLDNEKAQAQAEVNSYFEKIKTENGFSKEELDSLNTEFVEKCDLEGLKAKEAELCVAKFKSLRNAEKANIEINSNYDDNTLFFSTKNENVETNTATDGSELFA